MSASAVTLDKALEAQIEETYGAISIRVVVLNNKATSTVVIQGESQPEDIEPDEILDESDAKRPIDGYLESPKRGRYCCVFLVNGQRQHAWDNTFIIRDLGLKYLRNRMLVMVDIDGLHPEAIAMLMQGSRHQFYEGEVYEAIARRVISTLKADPDLLRLEEEAEQELSSLKSGDEVVKAALDQLIESHHASSPRSTHGHAQAGQSARDGATRGGLDQTVQLVVETSANVGVEVDGPVLAMSPDLATLRLKPNEGRSIEFCVRGGPGVIEQLHVFIDPHLPELQITTSMVSSGALCQLLFAEKEDADTDQYPVHATFRAVAQLAGVTEPRAVERPLVVAVPSESQDRKPKPPPELLENPSSLQITSRMPLRMVAGGSDLHVKLRWNGKDSLVEGDEPQWRFSALSISSHAIEYSSFTKPVGGRFELLLRVPADASVGDKVPLIVEATGPGEPLTAAATIEVVAAPVARRIESKIHGGAQRSPDYNLVYVTRNEWATESCWNKTTWTKHDPGAFQEATSTTPLLLIINEDYDLFAELREELTSRRLAESTIQERKTRYTSHVAYHLWQMFKATDHARKNPKEDSKVSSEDEMREEIKRVASTLIRLTRLT